ncbi:MAG TPA: bifunctional phosphoglucose/phosphomannose isomerase [Solirubrobacteraceae bacterium]|nr:bifunctional phosphoglucose/phosphomannose isomerase [Solirubrobacteraceae bacterium]
MSTTSALSREAIAAVDPTGQMADILGLPEHLGDALWRVQSANLSPQDSPGGLVVAGMGGSAVGGLLALAALGDRASRPIVVARDYGLPAWTTPDATVLCASYSGETEETLAAYEAAGALGARRIVSTTGGTLASSARADGVPVIPLPGGFQPRAAVGYGLVVALEVAALAGCAEQLHTEIDVAVARAEELVGEWGPDAPEDSLAKTLARSLHGTIPQIAGAGLTAPIAYRWKTQINENANAPAFASELPELDHNEVVGWESAADLGRFSAVFLDDCDLHPRVRTRIELTLGVIGDHAAAAHRIETLGQTRVERLVSLVLLGDLVSIYMAVLAGRDPAAIAPINQLKAALAARSQG